MTPASCRRFVLRYACCCSKSSEAKTAMDYIWTPWRYQYITKAIAGTQPDCIFCDAAKREDDATTLVVHIVASALS